MQRSVSTGLVIRDSFDGNRRTSQLLRIPTPCLIARKLNDLIVDVLESSHIPRNCSRAWRAPTGEMRASDRIVSTADI